MSELFLIATLLCAAVLAFFIGTWWSDWTNTKERPFCTLRVQQGQRQDGRVGKWRWQSYNNQGELLAMAPPNGFDTRLQAESAGCRAMRGWHIEVEVASVEQTANGESA